MTKPHYFSSNFQWQIIESLLTIRRKQKSSRRPHRLQAMRCASHTTVRTGHVYSGSENRNCKTGKYDGGFLCRFIKKRTGITFIDSLNEIRLGHASRILIDTTNSISEVSYSCEFNSISNFNRLLKKKKGCTPKEFPENFSGERTFFKSIISPPNLLFIATPH
jgi:AraC-like DNA-binding protein